MLVEGLADQKCTKKPVFPPRGESADGGMAGKAGDTDLLIARESEVWFN
jgi:hypothetical protein